MDPEARVGLFPLFALIVGEADFVDFEVIIYFCSALRRGIDVLGPRGTNLFLQCTSFGGVDRLDPEARIYFLQCTYFGGVDLFDPEASV